MLSVVTLAVAFARRYFGDTGLLGVAALSGLADVDALTLSVARMGEASAVAASAILLTVAVNSVAKAVYAWFAGTARLSLIVLAATLAAAAAGALVLLWR
jgi:uncharacterized membrane protein (DUF4010 family)